VEWVIESKLIEWKKNKNLKNKEKIKTWNKTTIAIDLLEIIRISIVA
jgi:hypothetical protein